MTARARARVRAPPLPLTSPSLTLTLSLRLPSYDVRTTETVVLTVPYGVLLSQQRPAGEVAFAVEAVAGTAVLEGTVLPVAAERLLNTLGQAAQSFTVTLTGDVWDPAIGLTAGAHTQGFIAGLASAQAEPAGWNAVVRPALSHAHLLRLSDTVLRVALPARAAYDISQPETVTLTLTLTFTLTLTLTLTPTLPRTLTRCPPMTSTRPRRCAAQCRAPPSWAARRSSPRSRSRSSRRAAPAACRAGGTLTLTPGLSLTLSLTR